MPIDYKRYGKDWPAVRAHILERAGDRCERCGVPNHALILRCEGHPQDYYVLRDDSIHYLNNDDDRPVRLSEMDDVPDKAYTKVVLTIHHIGVNFSDGSPSSPLDKLDNRDENLIALCSRCHLLADKELHLAARRRTLRRKHEAALARRREQEVNQGQMELFHDR